MMPPIPRSEQQVEKLIGHIAELTTAIRDLTATSTAPDPALDLRISGLEGNLRAAEARIEKLERKP